MIQITCYQTCKIDSKDWQTLYDSFPHHAIQNELKKQWQWLGSGYYFWPDSPTCAVWWGDVRLRQPYCITSYLISIEYEAIFDMTGNIKHIEYFSFMMDMYKKAYDKAARFCMKKLPAPSVSTVIDHFRTHLREEVFNYKAVKIHNFDDFVNDDDTVKMTPISREVFVGLSRIQLCIFKGEEKCISEKTPHSPNDYCSSIAQAC
ncbi:hypothetical protein [Acinetobacter guillouiae]|uniref:hypothetical protein n=1 Tax=Acinetobacter guillouiae TaxID=106649 RepID=UPI001CD54DE0|nr:hypothetical protein [Acinetobacter guillouiae]